MVQKGMRGQGGLWGLILWCIYQRKELDLVTREVNRGDPAGCAFPMAVARWECSSVYLCALL